MLGLRKNATARPGLALLQWSGYLCPASDEQYLKFPLPTCSNPPSGLAPYRGHARSPVPPAYSIVLRTMLGTAGPRLVQYPDP